MQPHIALIWAWWKALPEDVRPPGDPPVEACVKTAALMRDAGFTPERVAAFVQQTYSKFRAWARKKDLPGLMSLDHVCKNLRAWESRRGEAPTREMSDEEQRAYWGAK